MKTRVTQSEIGRVAGVHNTTVSLALRNSPAIPEATRKRIQMIAKTMGYHPDPALRALVAYRNGRMPSRRQETLAYVTNWTSRWGWQDMPAHAKYYAGAQRKAAQSGYQLDHFWFGEPDMTPRRLGSMLFHRGITGVILASHRGDCDALGEMDWSRLSAVKIGCFPHAPALHRVADDQSAVIRLAMKRILGAGYERIGLVMPYRWDDFSDQAWSAGFLAELHRLPVDNRIPILLHGHGKEASAAVGSTEPVVDLRTLDEWYYRYQPEVILGFGPFVRRQIEKLGLSVPRDVAFVNLFLDGPEPGVAGIQGHSEQVGEVATELLISQMHQNICGVPAVTTSTLVEGVWVPGESLPSIRPAFHWRDETFASPHLYSERNLVGVP